MSKFRVLLLAVLFAGFLAFAQDSAQTSPATTPPASATASPRRPYGDRAEQRLKRLSRKINLSDDQKEKIRPIFQDEEKQLSGLESDNNLTPQQKKRRTREIRMASREQMGAILTPEQKEKIQSGKTGAGGRHRMHSGKANSGASTPDTSDQQQ